MKSTWSARKLLQVMGQHIDNAMTPETQDTLATMTPRDVDTETGGLCWAGETTINSRTTQTSHENRNKPKRSECPYHRPNSH